MIIKKSLFRETMILTSKSISQTGPEQEIRYLKGFVPNNSGFISKIYSTRIVYQLAVISIIILLAVLFNLNVKAQLSSRENYIPVKSFVPEHYPELYYEIQIANLNNRFTLELFYDQTVQEYIDLFLNERMKDYMVFRERSLTYFPLFEKYLAEYNLPAEIKYMAVLESGLSPTACSPSMAVGLWQFKERTASHFGLEINSWVDERTDPDLSTVAACRYLSELYNRFNSWELSLLAYNTGPTALSDAIKDNNGNTEYTTLLPHLSLPAQRYMPALVAIIYLFENHENHF